MLPLNTTPAILVTYFYTSLPRWFGVGTENRTRSIPAWKAGAPPFMRHPHFVPPMGVEPICTLVKSQMQCHILLRRNIWANTRSRTELNSIPQNHFFLLNYVGISWEGGNRTTRLFKITICLFKFVCCIQLYTSWTFSNILTSHFEQCKGIEPSL